MLWVYVSSSSVFFLRKQKKNKCWFFFGGGDIVVCQIYWSAIFLFIYFYFNVLFFALCTNTHTQTHTPFWVLKKAARRGLNLRVTAPNQIRFFFSVTDRRQRILTIVVPVVSGESLSLKSLHNVTTGRQSCAWRRCASQSWVSGDVMLFSESRSFQRHPLPPHPPLPLSSSSPLYPFTSVPRVAPLYIETL